VLFEKILVQRKEKNYQRISKKEKSIGKWCETNDLERLYIFDFDLEFHYNKFAARPLQRRAVNTLHDFAIGFLLTFHFSMCYYVLHL
jgi:hypothetical protein